MKPIKSIFTVILCWALCACSILDKEPYSLTPDTYFNTEDEISKWVQGIYSPLINDTFYGEAYPMYVAGGDDLAFFQRSTGRSSMICANITASNTEIAKFWRMLYDGINRANILLENVDNNPSISLAFRDKARAEALFMRSFYYSHLVIGWGDVPLRLTTPTSPNNLAYLPASDRQVIYDQLIGDIESAIPYLPSSDQLTHTSTATKSAAYGILARVYLFRAGEHYRQDGKDKDKAPEYFAKAKEWAMEVVKTGLHGLVDDYTRVFIDIAQDKYNSTGVRESIWEADMAGNARVENINTWGRIGSTIGFGATSSFATDPDADALKGMANPGYSNRAMFTSLKLFELHFEDQGVDYYEQPSLTRDQIRGAWNIQDYEYVQENVNGKLKVTGRSYFYGMMPAGMTSVDGYPCTEKPEAQSLVKVRCVAKYRREYEQVIPKDQYATPINFPILRYSDVLLMLAEAENELNGPTDLARDCFDQVRDRARISRVLPTISKDNFREAVKRERAMELCFEGVRRNDLIRWGDFLSAMQGMTYYVAKDGWHSSYKYALNYYQVTPGYLYFPIPQSELSTNKAMKQTSGW